MSRMQVATPIREMVNSSRARPETGFEADGGAVPAADMQPKIITGKSFRRGWTETFRASSGQSSDFLVRDEGKPHVAEAVF